MSFFFRWVRREIQNDLSWILVFVLSLSFGLLGFVGLESFRQSLDTTLREKARSFLSADLAASSRRSINDQELVKIRSIVHPVSESHLTDFLSMAASTRGSRLVQIKAIDRFYPLYGQMTLGSGKIISSKGSEALADRPVVWVYPELLSQLQVQVGDHIKVGKLQFEIADIIKDDATQTFRLGGLAPKIYMSRLFLEQTGLIGFGTTSTDLYLFEIKNSSEENLKQVSSLLENTFDDPNLQFATPLDSAQDTVRALNALLDYLGLVSLVGLALSLVGVSYLTQLFLSRRISTFCLLRTLGLRSRLAEVFVMLELSILGSIAALLIWGIATPLLPALGGWLNPLLPVKLNLFLDKRSALLSLGLATLLPSLIAWPLLRPFRRINLKQVLLDRELWQLRPSPRDILAWIPSVILFFGLAVWVSHSLKTAGLFLGAVLISGVTVLGLAVLILKHLPIFSSTLALRWQWNQIRIRLSRNPFRFAVVIVALSFGTLLLVILPQIRESLQSELSTPDGPKLPSLFLFDIQDEQISHLQEFVKPYGTEVGVPAPLIRGRILSVNKIPFERTQGSSKFQSREQETDARFRNRGVNLTFRGALSESEGLEQGTAFSAVAGAVAEISVESRYADRLGLKIGDELNFDIQGIEVPGIIKNLRAVNWTSFQPNFFITFQPGFLDAAPKTWLMSLRLADPAQKTNLQNELVRQFPNVSIIDISQVIEKVLELTDQMSLALTAMAILSVLVGLFVLLTVSVAEAQSRMVEWNLYKVLGANGRDILKLFLLESAVVSLLAVSLGGLLGTVFSFSLMKWAFASRLVFSPGPFFVATAAPFLLSIGISFRLGQRLTRTDAAMLLAESV